jgi:hypothetical protein
LKDIFNYTNNIEEHKGENIIKQIKLQIGDKERLSKRSIDYFDTL